VYIDFLGERYGLLRGHTAGTISESGAMRL
jgi:hypothetical protein